jgi:hypothetical protein
MTRSWTLIVVLSTAIVCTAVGAAFACEGAGPNTHMGVVMAVDLHVKTLTLKDAQTGKPLTFNATPEQLRGVKVNDEVAVVYAVEGTSMRATSIKKG